MIINTASVNSYDPGEELIDYASTKAAILNLTKGMAKQLAKKGIRVNAVAPGPVWTPLQVAGGQLPGTMGEFGKDTPMKRAGQPAELAPSYVFFAAEQLSSYYTGEVLAPIGGETLQPRLLPRRSIAEVRHTVLADLRLLQVRPPKKVLALRMPGAVGLVQARIVREHNDLALELRLGPVG